MDDEWNFDDLDDSSPPKVTPKSKPQVKNTLNNDESGGWDFNDFSNPPKASKNTSANYGNAGKFKPTYTPHQGQAGGNHGRNIKHVAVEDDWDGLDDDDWDSEPQQNQVQSKKKLVKQEVRSQKNTTQQHVKLSSMNDFKPTEPHKVEYNDVGFVSNKVMGYNKSSNQVQDKNAKK